MRAGVATPIQLLSQFIETIREHCLHLTGVVDITGLYHQCIDGDALGDVEYLPLILIVGCLCPPGHCDQSIDDFFQIRVISLTALCDESRHALGLQHSLHGEGCRSLGRTERIE
jgi:hypothetical protein